MAVTVLLVEDDELVRCVTAELLRDEGFKVYEAHDGDLAALFINTGPAFDVLLTDINMPGTMDGWDLADHARGCLPNLPLIVVSGRANNVARWRKLGPLCTFFQKPCRMRDLATEVLRLTGLKQVVASS